jgi:DNA-binding NtrC family response regulator
MYVYFVDEEPIILSSIQELISDLGHEVITFKSIDELRITLRDESQNVDLIIADERLFIKDEMKVLHEIQKNNPDLIVFLTISNSPALQSEEALAHNVRGFLRKPLSLKEIEFLLERLSQQREIG